MNLLKVPCKPTTVTQIHNNLSSWQTEPRGLRVQGQPQLNNKVKTNQSDMRSWLKPYNKLNKTKANK